MLALCMIASQALIRAVVFYRSPASSIIKAVDFLKGLIMTAPAASPNRLAIWLAECLLVLLGASTLEFKAHPINSLCFKC